MTLFYALLQFENIVNLDGKVGGGVQRFRVSLKSSQWVLKDAISSEPVFAELYMSYAQQYLSHFQMRKYIYVVFISRKQCWILTISFFFILLQECASYFYCEPQMKIIIFKIGKKIANFIIFYSTKVNRVLPRIGYAILKELSLCHKL